MEHESFENAEIAKILNDHFVAIKVDREERPDVDRVYMTYLQVTIFVFSSSLGSRIFDRPHKEAAVDGLSPFGWLHSCNRSLPARTFHRTANACTVVPGSKNCYWNWTKHGWPSRMKSSMEAKMLSKTCWQAWQDRQPASKMIQYWHRQAVSKPVLLISPTISMMIMEASALNRNSLNQVEAEGSFVWPPIRCWSFVVNFNFLLTHAALSHQAKGKVDVARLAIDMTRLTLTKMSLGGINDQLGKGFHRYSTDNRWHVPHFEKMLYDQGQIAVALADTYAVSTPEPSILHQQRIFV